MKYKAIIDTDDFEDFEFYEDGNGKYIHGIDAGSVNGEWIALYFIECKQEPIEPILNKIKAEIEALPKTYPFINHFDTYVKEDDVRRIIDKYKAEMESEE